MQPQTTLLILAAGMGSRYGSLKQMDGIGPSKEAILDYSVYDAIRAGFNRVVFVIRQSFGDEFKEVFNKERFGGKIDVDYVFQELDDLPEGFSLPEGRTKPWGTNHAVIVAQNAVHTPFAVINADDFYGKDAFRVMHDYLVSLPEGSAGRYCMVGYLVGNTLSDNGTVSRGVCTSDSDSNLVSIVERTKIERRNGQIVYIDDDGSTHPLDDNTIVSMNMFGFTPDYFIRSREYFKQFLSENISNPKAEFFIPLMTNKLITEKQATLKVLSSTAEWFGVTYKEDRPGVVARLEALIEAGQYPRSLWGR
ncbi:MAG: nucleotidyltransferase [Rikenellaceae bacterium]|nr:nucleotidyltransferase [Rikenellaceae bacterium]